MRKLKLFSLFAAMLIATSTWADTKTFTSFSQGNNTQSPVSVYCITVYSSRIYLHSIENILISVPAGYTINTVEFTVYSVNSRDPITATNGTLSNTEPGKGDIVTVSNVNNTQTVLESYLGSYYINQIKVTYTASTYTVNFDKQSGSGGSNSVTATYGSAMPSMTKPTRSGYTFGGYYDQKNGAGTQYYDANGGSVRSWDKTSNTTLYAKWTATYSVSYDANGGTGAPSSQTKTHGVNLTLQNKGSLSRTGYTTDGWATSTGGNKAYDFGGTYSNNAAIKLYAHWNANTYKVKFYGNGSTSGSMSDQNFTYGTAQNLTANGFSKTGYTFAGWATSADGSVVYSDKKSVNNLTATNGGTFNLYAKWTVSQYTIKFNNYDGTQLQSSQVNYGATPAYTGATPTKPSTAAYTYTFNGWSPAIATVTGNATYTAQFTEQINQATVDAAIALINAIDDPVVYTDACHQEILDARAAYNNLTQAQKDLVDATTLQKLTDAEAAYAALEADHNAANAVVNLINAIGSPITAASQTAINAARNAYEALSNDQKALVGNLSALTNAEAALAVVNQIAAIGEVTLSSGSTIADVRAAYNALTGDQQALVGNYATLTDAEAAYNTLVTDHAAADAVIDKINAIGSPITAASQTAIEEARAAYNALTDTQKGYVTNYSELTDAEAALAVVNLINAIDDPVVYTDACHQEILDARAVYEALSDERKALVDATTLQVLTDAEAAYDALEADHNAANAVIDKINAIDDPVVYTDACHQEILDAREAYNNLTQAQKDLIDASTLQKLTDAEDAYASLNVDITAKLDPVNDGVYYSTFYDGSRQLQLPANVEAYTATVNGDKMLLKKVAVPGDILPAATAVVLRASQADFTLIPSAASPVSVENNALRGTDVNVEVPSEHCYVLSGADGFVGFYPLSGSYTLTAHKAYIDLDNLPGGANNAPRRLRFVFDTATDIDHTNAAVESRKVLENGVLYIIKNGVRYNAQGQLIK